MRKYNQANSPDNDVLVGFTAEGGWRLVITYLRRYEAFGVILKSEQLMEAKDLWIDLDDIKNYFVSNSEYG